MYNVSVKRGGELDSMFIGFDELFGSMGLSGVNQNANYPPTDIWTEASKTYIQLAVAGFKKNDLNIVVENDSLRVYGIVEKSTNSKEKKYHLSRISRKSFDRVFALNRDAEVESAEIVDGMLTIVVNLKQPKQDVKKIEIK